MHSLWLASKTSRPEPPLPGGADQRGLFDSKPMPTGEPLRVPVDLLDEDRRTRAPSARRRNSKPSSSAKPARNYHRGSTPLRAGFKRMVNEAGEPLKFDAATDYTEKHTTEAGSERVSAAVEFLILPEAFRREICKGFDSRAVAELLRRRGHLKNESDRLTIKHRLPGVGANSKAPVYHVLPSILKDDV